MKAIPGIAVFDIGKTNKKFFFFNQQYEVVEERVQTFTEVPDDDGFFGEDLEALTQWLKNTLDEKLADPRLDIRAIHFSAYGASFVHLDKTGRPIAPLYNYVKPYPSDLLDQFYATYGKSDDFSTTTASPNLGHLNSGLQLYWIKHRKPDLFQRIEYSLHLPQYLAFLVHGQKWSEMTSIGCHTGLWDFQKKDYHSWVLQEGIISKLAPIQASIQSVPCSLHGKSIQVGIGLHDSSAAFIPYMQVLEKPFLLISTGTWSISMNPFNVQPLTVEELRQDCLTYINYQGHPVKASRLFAGYAHEQAVQVLCDRYLVAPAYFHQMPFNPEWCSNLVGNASWNSPQIGSEQAYHLLIFDLVKKQKHATDLVLANSSVTQIFVDGGFAKNDIFMQALKRCYPHMEVFAATISQATALGAALAIHKQWNPLPVPVTLISQKPY